MKWFVFALALSACSLDLPNESILDRTRILAARAEPAQPVIGAPYTVTSYAYAPSGTPTVVWCAFPCDPTAPLVSELSQLDWDDLTPKAQTAQRQLAAKQGIVGVEPGMPVLAIAPEGVSQVGLLAYGVPPEGDDIEQATLTLDVASDEPNTHPRIRGIRVDDTEVASIGLDIDQVAVLDVPFEDDEDDENASVRWYTDANVAVDGPPGGGPDILGDGSLELAVDAAFKGIVVVVVRDGQGGADWLEVPLTVD
ncbi:MAG: hypothetical protein AAGA48_26260 [Myxococcota bacterium]